jgi:hypothetical protein
MANKIKFLKQIKLRDGSEKWAFNPPQYIKERPAGRALNSLMPGLMPFIGAWR